MVVYIVLILLTTYFMLVVEKTYAQRSTSFVRIGLNEYALNMRRLFYLAAFLIMVLVAASRTVGIDLYVYKGIYGNWTTKQNASSSYMEPLFAYAGYLFNAMRLNADWYIAFCSAITTLFMIWGISKYSQNKAMAMYIFMCLSCYFAAFNLVRQMLASSITFIGYKFLRDRQFFHYAVIVLIAFLFHRPAIIMLPIYFMCTWDWKHINLIMLCIAGIAFLLYSEPIFEFIAEKVPVYKDYLNTRYTVEGTESYKQAIISVVLFILPFIFRKSLISLDRSNSILLFLAFISVIISLIGYQIRIVERFRYYTDVYYILLLPEITNAVKKQKEKSFIVVVLFILGCVYFGVSIARDIHGVFPYQSLLLKS